MATMLVAVRMPVDPIMVTMPIAMSVMCIATRQVCNGHRLQHAQLGQSIEDGCTNIELDDLTLKRPGHHFLSQAFEAIHLGWHQALAVVATAALADTAPHSLARLNGLVAMRKGQPFTQSCSFTWRDDGDGAAAVTWFMHILCVICAVAREAGHLFRCWVFGQTAQPLLANHPPR